MAAGSVTVTPNPRIYRLPGDAPILGDRLSARKRPFDRALLSQVLDIFDDVAHRGDRAIAEATKEYDAVEASAIRAEPRWIDEGVRALDAPLRAAIEVAIANTRQVNREILPSGSWTKEIRPATEVGERVTALESVGLWVPARKGPLISTAVMLVVAAETAGVERIVVGSPPLADGRPDPVTVAAAKLAGAHEFVTGNGVAIIAGMSMGTESVPEVEGVYGPGSPGITAAMAGAFCYGKRTVAGIGPTDCVVLADATADPETVALDLCNEGEHGVDSPVVLITDFAELAEEVCERLPEVISRAPGHRRGVLERVFGEQGMGTLVAVPTMDDALNLVNEFAPEHIMVTVDAGRESAVLEGIRNAGEVLLGRWTPFSAANYAIGITAVLPTNGCSRRFSGITCRDMVKYTTTARLGRAGLEGLLPTIRALGEHETLPVHVEAARARVDESPA